MNNHVSFDARIYFKIIHGFVIVAYVLCLGSVLDLLGVGGLTASLGLVKKVQSSPKCTN